MDFEKDEIRIELLAAKDQDVKSARFRSMLTDLLSEDKQTAFERDTLAQDIEQRLEKETQHVKSATVAKEPILTPIIPPGKNRQQAIEQTVDAIMKSAVLEARPSGVAKTPTVIALKAPIPEGIASQKAARYKSKVDGYAKKQEIGGALVLAVIHTESDFNPMARSNAPAYGLMQIVPQSAGQDATAYLFGKPYILSPSYLYNDDNNINVGTAYLHVLYHDYLKGINDPESRLYCAIAAYNTGAGNMARAFSGDRNLDKAVGIINRKTPTQVYDTLIKKLPYDETKEYLKRVSGRMKQYQRLYAARNETELAKRD
ncbi:MAG: transglycosylase SLT domain-containing protein [Gammaproteobacteria bacterium]|nr:transglycosylase SLT domain-containing protein [Gammaproteobacteria bacterium]